MRIKDLGFGLHKFGGQMSSSSSSSSKICMNGLCGATTTPQWKKGWPMKAGGFATLCYSCGMAYENVSYCERFHLNEPGWRECKFCEKPIHCGCVVSKYLHECLDLGGITCIKCLRATGNQPLKLLQSYPNDIPNGFAPFSATWHPVIGSRMNGGTSLDKGKLAQLSEALDKHQQSPSNLSIGHQIRQDDNRLCSGEFGMGYSSGKDIGTIFPNQSSLFTKPDNSRTNLGMKAMYEGLPQPSLGFSLGNALGTPNSSVLHSIPAGAVEGREQEKGPTFKHLQKSRHLFQKQSKTGGSVRTQPNKGVVSQNRVARPPVEGRGRNQLLPRYWPKITDQELEQISGDLKSNSTLIPLFEKVLSASDAGRIGRLVLPKACAEAYFPPINQSEGLPIRIQDIKGKEWTFQFRFWPNNNSRMYVLEGVTPCIQNMQLQAGDTVIFSRLDPEEKLVIGCRKQAVSPDTREVELYAPPNVLPGGNSSSGLNENQPSKNMEHEGMANGDSVQRPLIPEKKRARNIGSKSKRLLMHSEDAMELKVTWEEAQELFRPPLTSKPTIVMIEDCEFEEYEEPPVFGKKTLFTTRANGLQEQWAQCDSCSKMRKLPLDVLLPPKWTCSDNVWDPDRCSCSAPDEISVKDFERFFRFGKESKKRKLTERRIIEEEDEEEEQQQQEPSALDALATAAVGESVGEFGESSTGPTTRHPRHRPGCTCIVCIQPPSGKGKHKPNCLCNVCLTVKRRFKTLMLRKKKRLSEKEAEMAQKSLVPAKDEPETGGGIGNDMGMGLEMMGIDHLENGVCDRNGTEAEAGESSSKGGGQQLDLNCDPNKEEEMMLSEAEIRSMTSLVTASGVRLDWQNVVARLASCSRSKGSSDIEQVLAPPPEEKQASSELKPSPSSPPPPPNPTTDEGCPSPMDEEPVELEMDKKVVEGR